MMMKLNAYDHLDADETRARLHRARRRIDALRELLSEGPRRVGECDECHADRVTVFEDSDEEPDAGWQWCASCVRTRQGHAARRIQCAQYRLRELGAAEAAEGAI